MIFNNQITLIVSIVQFQIYNSLFNIFLFIIKNIISQVIMQKTICQVCSEKFSEKNPPRIVPNCGHCFCQSCIKGKLNTSNSNIVYFICPTDKRISRFINNDIENFPKNISLIGEIKHLYQKSYNSLKDILVPNIQRHLKSPDTKQKHFQNSRNLTKKGTQTTISSDIIRSKQFLQEQFQFNIQDICLIHQKGLQIVCIQDSVKICPSCAIFGDHKGHTCKSINQVEQDKIKMHTNIVSLFDKKQKICSKINEKQTKQLINKSLGVKFQSLTKLVNQKYSKLIEIVKEAQSKTIEKLIKTFQIAQDKIVSQLQFFEYPIAQYKLWQDKAFKQLSILESKTNFQQQLQILNYKNKNNLIEQGNKILTTLQDCNKSQIDNIKQHIESIIIEFNQQIETKIHQYSNVLFKQSKHNKSMAQEQFLLKQNSVIQECLLDQVILTKRKTNSSLYIPNSYHVNMHKIRSNRFPSDLKQENISSIRSPNKFTDMMQSMNSSKQIKQVKKKLKVKLQDKYQKAVQVVMNQTSDILDLSNAELGDQNVIQILQYLKNKKIRVIKLIRNKITDQIFNNLIPLIASVSSINFSQNNLTDKVIDILLLNYKRIPNLKSIILSQNKIKERNIKNKLQQIKKLDIVVSL